MAALVDAGVTWVQPGIESLHSEVLALMDKGIQGWQNVQLLKWARELGLRLSWSILWGFPGEKDDWYADMASWMPALEHLPPPAGTHQVRFDRDSVYHQNTQRYGLILFPVGSMSIAKPTARDWLPKLRLQTWAPVLPSLATSRSPTPALVSWPPPKSAVP